MVVLKTDERRAKHTEHTEHTELLCSIARTLVLVSGAVIQYDCISLLRSSTSYCILLHTIAVVIPYPTARYWILLYCNVPYCTRLHSTVS